MSGTTGDGEFGFQIAPMLDILFVLLLFFMITAGVQKREAIFVTPMPGRGDPGPQVPIQIGIDADGQVSIAGVAVDSPADHNLPATLDRLRTAVALDAGQPVYVTPARATVQQRVMDVVNACSAAGVRNLAFGSPTSN